MTRTTATARMVSTAATTGSSNNTFPVQPLMVKTTATPPWPPSPLALPPNLHQQRQQNKLHHALSDETSEASTASSITLGASTSGSSGAACDGENAAVLVRILHLPAKQRHDMLLGLGSVLTSRSNCNRSNICHDVPVKVQDFSSQSIDKFWRVHVASATMAWKGEDRHNVVFLDDRSSNNKNSTGLKVFLGVYDGHDGPEAAKYCAAGLLPHLLSEMTKGADNETRTTPRSSERRRRLFRKSNKHKNTNVTSSSSSNVHREARDDDRYTNNDNNTKSTSRRFSTLQPHFCRAFEQAQHQFAETGMPPDSSTNHNHNHHHHVLGLRQQAPPEQVPSSSPSASRKLSSLMRRAFHKENDHNNDNVSKGDRIRSGGTTACTLSIFSNYPATSTASNNNETPDLFAIVANCGDSRLVSDHGGSWFRAVTKDHRVVDNVEDAEMLRLLAAHARILNKRIYPGGLAVSRTIGDTAYSSACIPTPDCYALRGQQQQRIILATDGLWDSLRLMVKQQLEQQRGGTKELPAQSVEGILAQLAGRDSVKDPKTAAVNLMKRCLKEVGCVDDITIIVVDISPINPH